MTLNSPSLPIQKHNKYKLNGQILDHLVRVTLKKMKYLFNAPLGDDSRWFRDVVYQFSAPNSVRSYNKTGSKATLYTPRLINVVAKVCKEPLYADQLFILFLFGNIFNIRKFGKECFTTNLCGKLYD